MDGMVVGGLFNAFAFAGAGFLFSNLNHSRYKDEIKRHNLALEQVMQKLKQFNNWIISMVPEPIKRTVSDKLKALKETISKIYSKGTPKEIESALKGTSKTFLIKGGSTDYKTYLQNILSPTTTLLDKQSKPIKVRLRIQCQFRKMENGEEIFTDYTSTQRIMSWTSLQT